MREAALSAEAGAYYEILLYDDGSWQVLYTVPDAATVVIRSIAHALDLPG